MSRGGSRPNSGPAPEPDALRRERDFAGWVKLPAGGRVGDPPEWTLDGIVPRERELWEELWRRPQAVMWEKHRRQLEVALYVRSFVEAEKPGATAAMRNLVVRMQGELQLTEDSLRKARWIIVEPEWAEKHAAAQAAAAEAKRKAPARRGTTATKGSAKDRLKVIRGGKTSSR